MRSRGFGFVCEEGLHRVEAIPVPVIWPWRLRFRVHLVDRVARTVEVEVEADVEEVLVDHPVEAFRDERPYFGVSPGWAAAVAMIPVALTSDETVPFW